MIFTKRIMHVYHSSRQLFAREKSALATLRKKTGYSISNCKKALEMHNNDLGAAENWLQDQAQALGWKKASKVEGRLTAQGLIGVIVKNPYAALIELNCETDFVAKSKEFKHMVEVAAYSCVNFISKHNNLKAPIIKVCFDADQLRELRTRDGKKLSDMLALMIGTIGENATLKRAFCYKVQRGMIHLAGYAHPSGSELNDIHFGKFGAIMAFRQYVQEEVDLNLLGKDLCQHIVGMNPKFLGSSEFEPADKNEDEESLLHQEYLLDETITVADFLSNNGIEVLDFKRFQCGELSSESGSR